MEIQRNKERRQPPARVRVYRTSLNCLEAFYVGTEGNKKNPIRNKIFNQQQQNNPNTGRK